MKKRKPLFNGEMHEKYLQLVESSGLPYRIIQSTYTTEIKSDAINIQWRQNTQSDSAFIAGDMIKRDLKNSNFAVPEIDPKSLIYFEFAPPQKLLKAKATVFNIDLKSAYASILKQHGLIAPQTAVRLSKLAKKDRLAAVGMLAASKRHFIYEPGAEMKIEEYRNELAGWFFYCILETQKIMEEMKAIAGRDFLFYWVDGIYFENEKHRLRCETLLKSKGYDFSFDVLRDFSVYEFQWSYEIIYRKGEGEKEKEKHFRVGKTDYSINRRLLEMLGVHAGKTNITRHSVS